MMLVTETDSHENHSHCLSHHSICHQSQKHQMKFRVWRGFCQKLNVTSTVLPHSKKTKIALRSPDKLLIAIGNKSLCETRNSKRMFFVTAWLSDKNACAQRSKQTLHRHREFPERNEEFQKHVFSSLHHTQTCAMYMPSSNFTPTKGWGAKSMPASSLLADKSNVGRTWCCSRHGKMTAANINSLPLCVAHLNFIKITYVYNNC